MPASQTKIDRELAHYNELKETLRQIAPDEETLLDTLEGETNLHEALLAIDASIMDDEIQLEGLKAVQEKLATRQARIARTIETKRNLILQTMDSADIKTIRGPAATLTKGTVNPGLEIIDEAQIPAKFWVNQDPKLDKKMLKSALENGEEIDGAELDNGGISLTIRRK